jgi:replicative DNA helicase
MTNKSTDSLGYLGHTFQLKLLNQVLFDDKFSLSIIGPLDPSYFDNEYLRLISSKIKDYHEKYETIPELNTLEQILMTDIKREITKQNTIDVLNEIKETSQKDCLYVQETALKFCKQQELKKATKKIQKILDLGDFDRYQECEEILKVALNIGDVKDNGIDVFTSIDDVLSDDFRNPIPTGINGLDGLMNGGLSKGELGVILAAFGVGKSTMITKIANTGYNLGYNVVQIFFEDNPKVIQRKHITCWTGINLNDLTTEKERIKVELETVKEFKGNLILKKFPSDGTTITHIKQYLRKLTSDGIKPDLVLVDYIDCIQPSKRVDDANVAEGNVMREFESMIDELNVAGWTAIQGNRGSIGAQVVEANMIGGSIKKGQIGHFIVSIAKTLDQKEEGRATMAILKSRFGKDGVIFEDIVFDNGTLTIDTNSSNDVSFLDFGKNQDKKKSNRIQDALKLRQEFINNNQKI